MPPPPSYGLKDALLGLLVGLVLGGLSGFGLYAMSAETLRCERGAGGVDCRLSRHVLGVPVRDTRLAGVRGAAVEEYYSAPRTFPASNRQAAGGYTYHVQYDTVHGPVAGTEGPAPEGHQAIVDGLRAFLDDPAAATYDASLGGGPIGWRFALGVLFVVGALCLINIPFATVKAVRARPSAASPPPPGDSPSSRPSASG